MIFRVIDIETTGFDAGSEIIEIGRVDVNIDGEQWNIEAPMSRVYRPLKGIPPETMAVHHITPAEMSESTPVCTRERMERAVWAGGNPHALVAHNCEFERTFIDGRITRELPWICTYKVALRAWPTAPRHSNQVLRYWRGLTLDKTLAMPPHRAGPDAWVTAHLLIELWRTVPIPAMIQWTSEPAHYPTMPFGRYRSRPWSEVPDEYLEWLLRRPEQNKDVSFCASRELTRRRVG